MSLPAFGSLNSAAESGLRRDVLNVIFHLRQECCSRGGTTSRRLFPWTYLSDELFLLGEGKLIEELKSMSSHGWIPQVSVSFRAR